MKRQDNIPLSKRELEGLHSVLRRAAESAERRNDKVLQAQLEQELSIIDFEMRGG